MLAEWTSLYQQQMLAFTKATRILTQSHLGAWGVEKLVFLHGFWSQYAHVEAWVVQPQRNDVIVDAKYNANYIQLPNHGFVCSIRYIMVHPCTPPTLSSNNRVFIGKVWEKIGKWVSKRSKPSDFCGFCWDMSLASQVCGACAITTRPAGLSEAV